MLTLYLLQWNLINVSPAKRNSYRTDGKRISGLISSTSSLIMGENGEFQRQ